MTEQRGIRRHTTWLGIVCAIAILSPMAWAKPEATLTVMHPQGPAPWTVDLVVDASDPDGRTLYCTLQYWGDIQETGFTNPFEEWQAFFIEPPYEPRLFTYTYELAGEFHPTLDCRSDGHATVVTKVDVQNPLGNGRPIVSLTANPPTGSASLDVTYTLSTFDPDGDTLTCRFDSGLVYEETKTVTIAPPYNDRTFNAVYTRASMFNASVVCDDGQGGGQQAIKIINPTTPSSSNSVPTVDLSGSPSRGEAPHTVTYTVRANDADGDRLFCTLSPGGDQWEEREIFNISPPYGSVRFTYTYEDATHGEILLPRPNVSCADGKGGYRIDVLHNIRIDMQDGNREPAVALIPNQKRGTAPFDAGYRVVTDDRDGDRLTCEVSYGFGEAQETISISPPYDDVVLRHTYDRRDSYQASIACRDGRGGRGEARAWVTVDVTRFPEVLLLTGLASGPSPLATVFTVRGSDPDGDVLDCTMHYGDVYNGSGVIAEDDSFTLEPPYDDVILTHTYLNTNKATVSCSDGNGAMADDYDWVQVTTTAPDWVDVILSSLPRIGEAPLTVAFNADSWHTEMRPVDCVLDYGDGSAPELFHMDPPYLNKHFSYTYNVAGSFQASLHCFDSEGVSAYTTGEINVSMHPGNRDPEINAFSPSTVSGLAPLDVDFDLAASDLDGDLVACDISFGDGSSLSGISFGSPDYDPSTVSHRYEVHRDEPYTVVFSCIDRRGGAANWSIEVAVAKGANKEPSVRLGAAPPHGFAPLNVALTLGAADADLEPLSCELDLGQGKGSVPLTLTPPYQLTVFHLFSEPGAFVATLDCNDGTASATSLPLLIHVTAPEKRSLSPLSPLPPMDGGTLLGATPEGAPESKRAGDAP